MKVDIYVCYHKKDVYRKVDGYIPIHVGKANSSLDLGFAGDDTGDNISALNPWYCELTALYWAWKNDLDADYIGLTHYRRSFDFGAKGFNRLRRINHCNEDYFYSHSVFDENELQKYDVILPTYQHFCLSIAVNLCKNHVKKDVEILEDVVSRLYPEYLEDYKDVFLGNIYAPCNMLVARKEVFQGYCKWLFDILFEFSKRMSVPFDPYQPRVFGFYSERLMLVYMRHHKLRINQIPMTLLDGKNNPFFVKQYLRNGVANLVHYLYQRMDQL